ncbi:hypothetical protein [Nitratireductor luteus]|uniref:hypothetical protein n=1 Tax=Nitratireductor luteus TaxID=2976980 RepID=UPI002240BB32|nr:hypothetical protein [Nitratireductor luteus]
MSFSIYNIVGLSRSGNHAIIDWILSQLRGSWCFLNCVEAKADPFQSARPMDDDQCIRTNIAGWGRGTKHPGGSQSTDHVVLSQEDAFLGPAFGPETLRHHRRAFGQPERLYEILILRDPYNLIASRRRLGSTRISEHTAMRIWKQHAAALERFPVPRRGRVPINYNRWVSSAEYRKEVAVALNLEFRDAAAQSVPSCAGGSSFDGTTFDGRANAMAVFDRWRSCVDDPSFWELFDTRTERFCRSLFGFSNPLF